MKLESRLKALALLAKHVNVQAFVERLALTDEPTLARDLLEGRRRVRQAREKQRWSGELAVAR